MTFCLGRWRSERGFRHNIGPHRLYHRFEDRDGDTAAGRATAERTALAVRVVVANPDRDRNVVGERHEPGVVLLIGGAGLARDIRRKVRNRSCRAPRQDPLNNQFHRHELFCSDSGPIKAETRNTTPAIISMRVSYDTGFLVSGLHDTWRWARLFYWTLC